MTSFSAAIHASRHGHGHTRSRAYTLVATFTSAFGYTAALLVLPAAIAIIAARRIAGFSPRFDPLIRFGAAFIPAMFGIMVRTSGIGRIPFSEAPFIIVANHVNIFDGFVLRGRLPQSIPIRAMELLSHFSWPLYGTAMRLYGNIPVPHNAPRVALRSIARARRVLAQGVSILMLPEGHRTRTGRMQRFMRGPFKLARDAGVPILPVVMVGAYERQRVGHPRITPGRVEVRVGKAVTVNEIRRLDERALRETIRDRMERMLTGPGN